MRELLAAAILSGCWLSLAGPARALVPPSQITLDEALARALRDNPTIRSAEIQLQEALDEQHSASSYYWKALSANIGIMPPLVGGTTWNGTGGFVLQFNLGDLLVTGPENQRIAASSVKLADQALKQAKLQIAARVAAAHAGYVASCQVAELRSAAEQAADLDRQAVERDFAAGRATGRELRVAQLSWRQAAADSATAQGQVLKAWATLLASIGDNAALQAASAIPAAPTSSQAASQ
ncbi:MAG: TolC family protein [Cyanobacteria bacterium REEB65]|nr:TolC family protein [Cyanobacteria bacterium REEB65]